MSTHEALIANTSQPPSNEKHRISSRLGAVCWRFILALVLAGCSPVDGNSVPEPDAGVSVAERWAVLLETKDSLERTAAMAQFVTTLGTADADAIAEILTTRYRRHRSIDDLILWNAWGRLDPEAAMARAQVVGSPMAESIRGDVVLEWASRDPLSAISVVGTTEPAVRRALVRGWYVSGVAGLSEFVLGSDASRAGQHFIASYTGELAADKGAQGVADWIDSVRGREDLEPIMITHAHRKGIMDMGHADAKTAMAYCDLHCDEPYGESMRSRLADRLGFLGHGEEAVIWLEGAVDANQVERGRAARLAYRSWLRSDRDAAVAWSDEALGMYKNESWFLPLARLAIRVHTRADPESALEWIDVFTHPQDREDALVKIARRWFELDEQAAESWLETSSLDSEARTKARTPQAIRGRTRDLSKKLDPSP